MNAIERRFAKARVFLPVVHCLSPGQAHRAAEVAVENGADGVFLINQGGMLGSAVVDLARTLQGVSFVGVNLLGVAPALAADIIHPYETIDGLWCDDAGIVLNGRDDLYACAVSTALYVVNRAYFGGIAFKGQADVPHDRLAEVGARAVAAGVEVITTSGTATGFPPSPEKIVVLREAIGAHALAVASGITPENVGPFLPLVDAFLVATGIERAFGEFDPGRVRELAAAIHGGAA